MGYRKPCPLTPEHKLETFHTGKPLLDDWLMDMALYNQEQGYTRTFVIADGDYQVVGYHSLCAGMIHRDDVTRAVKGRSAPNEIPIALLARLGVSEQHQGNGLGGALLRHAFMSAVSANQSVAFRAVVVHAIDDDAVRFYTKHGFRETKGLDRRLIISTNDIVASLKKVTSYS